MPFYEREGQLEPGHFVYARPLPVSLMVRMSLTCLATTAQRKFKVRNGRGLNVYGGQMAVLRDKMWWGEKAECRVWGTATSKGG